jgi:hypothetical protein
MDNNETNDNKMVYSFNIILHGVDQNTNDKLLIEMIKNCTRIADNVIIVHSKHSKNYLNAEFRKGLDVYETHNLHEIIGINSILSHMGAVISGSKGLIAHLSYYHKINPLVLKLRVDEFFDLESLNYIKSKIVEEVQKNPNVLVTDDANFRYDRPFQISDHFIGGTYQTINTLAQSIMAQRETLLDLDDWYLDRLLFNINSKFDAIPQTISVEQFIALMHICNVKGTLDINWDVDRLMNNFYMVHRRDLDRYVFKIGQHKYCKPSHYTYFSNLLNNLQADRTHSSHNGINTV